MGQGRLGSFCGCILRWDGIGRRLILAARIEEMARQAGPKRFCLMISEDAAAMGETVLVVLQTSAAQSMSRLPPLVRQRMGAVPFNLCNYNIGREGKRRWNSQNSSTSTRGGASSANVARIPLEGPARFMVRASVRRGLERAIALRKSIEQHRLSGGLSPTRLDRRPALPEPWIGTGVYANAFRLQYHFRDGIAPHVRYGARRSKASFGGLPDYRQCYHEDGTRLHRLFPGATRDRLPIALTDTQSPFDTATLVLDASEFFTACYTEPELAARFLQQITDLIVEFSRVQMERIGPELLVQPGHVMPSVVGGRGISISDDNLAVSSPQINRRFALPVDEQLAKEFGGLAIHSCGVWTHTMSMLRDFQNITGIECAVGHERGDHDPNPNPPAQVRQAIASSSLVVKTRLGNDIEKALAALDELASPQLPSRRGNRLHPEHAERNYRSITERLERIYAKLNQPHRKGSAMIQNRISLLFVAVLCTVTSVAPAADPAPIKKGDCALPAALDKVRQDDSVHPKRTAPLIRGALWVVPCKAALTRERLEQIIQAQCDVGFNLLWIHNSPELLAEVRRNEAAGKPYDPLEMIFQIADRRRMRAMIAMPTDGWYGKAKAEDVIDGVGAYVRDIHARYGKHPSLWGWYLKYEINPIHRMMLRSRHGGARYGGRRLKCVTKRGLVPS